MRFWLLILQDVTLGSDSSCSCRWYPFNLSLLGWNPGERPQSQTSGIQSGGDGEDCPFPINVAGRTHRDLPETSWGCGRTSLCSSLAARM